MDIYLSVTAICQHGLRDIHKIAMLRRHGPVKRNTALTRSTSFSSKVPARAGVFGLCFAVALAVSSFWPALSQASADTSLFGSYLAARHAAGLRDNKTAAEYYRDALKLDPDDETILERAFLLEVSAGKIDAATDLAQRILKVDQKHQLARLVLAVQAIRARQYPTARRHLSQSDAKGPVAELTNGFLTAWALQGQGDVKQALDVLSKLEGAEWFKIYRAYHAALIADLAGQKDIAAAHFKEAHSLDSGALRIMDAYGRFLIRSGDKEGARELLSTFDKVAPAHPLAQALQADLDAGRLPDPAVSSTQAGAAEGLYSIGAALGRERGEDLAIVYLQLALHLDPNGAYPLIALADIYDSQQRHEMAAELYGRVPETSPLKASAEIQRAISLNALERTDDAIAVLEELIKREPGDSEAVIALGNIQRQAKNFADAARVYSQAIAQLATPEQRHWSLFYFRGISYERSKEWPKAEADFKKALDLYPDQPLVLNYLGYSWVDQGIHLNDAMKMIEKAVQLRPNDGYIVDSLGWAYYKLGDYESAVRELERAVELKPEDPVINDHLGDAYWHVGRKLEARFQWSHAQDLKPEPEELSKIQAKLENGLNDEEETKAAAERAQKKNNGG